jgi:gentisate 1,2-dioxygenase
VFDGSGTVTVGDKTWSVIRGDLFVVPSWEPFSVKSRAGGSDSDSGALDLFRFSDAPVFEALKLNRTQTEGITR